MRAPHAARPYFFEWFTLGNLLLIQALLWSTLRVPLGTLPHVVATLAVGFLLQAAIGVGLRALVAWRRGTLRGYLAIIRKPSWIADTARIALFSGLFVHTYGWIKLAIPLLHPRLFDEQLWNLDRALGFGYSPNVFLLSLLGAPSILRTIDWTYANIFLASLNLAAIFFSSSPSRRIRVAFMDSNVAMWLIGAWLYVAVPSLGPAYRFPEVWLPLAPMFVHSQAYQHLLMANYQNVLAYARGVAKPINVLFGIAAFPSLHVAFQTLVFLWMRRVWRAGEMLFALFTVVIFVGSIVTGWHYLIDGIAGFLLAWACFALSFRAHRIDRWLAIRDAR